MIVWIILLATSVPVDTCPPPCECSATTVNCNNKNITDAQLLQMAFPTNLTSLRLTGNLLTHFPTQHFANTNFTKFYLDENRLTEIPKLDPKTTELLVLGNNRIGGSLSANNISWLCETGKTFILLKNNLIFEIEDSAFANCSDLYIIDLSGNRIRHLKRGTFAHFRNGYSKIDLRYNQISEIEAGTFGYNISILNLHKNNLATFDINWFVQPYGIRSLHLEENPIYCSCDLVKNLTRLLPLSVYGSCNKTWSDRFASPIDMNMLQDSQFDAPVHKCSRCTFVQHNDCANGGSCVDNADTSTFGNCQCRHGYRGQMCTEKDPCYTYGEYTCSGQRLLLSSFCFILTFVVFFMGLL